MIPRPPGAPSSLHPSPGSARRVERYLPYYREVSAWAPLRMAWDALLARSSVERLSLRNRQRDYLRIRGSRPLLALHLELNEELARGAREWRSYDYGGGYFYQSYDPACITGLRDTAARVAAMDLRRLLSRQAVLEVGCNTGCIALSVADVAGRLDGLDINPHLVAIARRLAAHVRADNARFETLPFEQWRGGADYDVVLSFANHATYDGNTRQSLREYFDRCAAALRPGGLLLFESHPPELEGAGLAGVLETIDRRFERIECRVLAYGSFLDRGRTFLVGRLRG